MEERQKIIRTAKINPSGLPHYQPELVKERKKNSCQLSCHNKIHRKHEFTIPVAGSGTVTGWNNMQQPLLGAYFKSKKEMYAHM